MALFDVIETIDREKIARAVADEMRKQQKQLRLYVQVNIGLEPQKAVFRPRRRRSFVSFCQNELGLASKGLMCIRRR